MQAGEALSSRAAQFGAEGGLSQPSHALALQGICCFAPGTAAKGTGSPVPLGRPSSQGSGGYCPDPSSLPPPS